MVPGNVNIVTAQEEDNYLKDIDGCRMKVLKTLSYGIFIIGKKDTTNLKETIITTFLYKTSDFNIFLVNLHAN